MTIRWYRTRANCAIRYTRNTIRYNGINPYSTVRPDVVPHLSDLEIIFWHHSGAVSMEQHPAAAYIAYSTQQWNDAAGTTRDTRQ